MADVFSLRHFSSFLAILFPKTPVPVQLYETFNPSVGLVILNSVNIVTLYLARQSTSGEEQWAIARFTAPRLRLSLQAYRLSPCW